MTQRQRILWKCLLVCLVGFSVLIGCRMSFIGPTTRSSGREARAERRALQAAENLPPEVVPGYLYAAQLPAAYAKAAPDSAVQWIGFYADGRVVASLGEQKGPQGSDSVRWQNAPMRGYAYYRNERLRILLLDASATGPRWYTVRMQKGRLLLRPEENGRTPSDTFLLSLYRLGD